MARTEGIKIFRASPEIRSQIDGNDDGAPVNVLEDLALVSQSKASTTAKHHAIPQSLFENEALNAAIDAVLPHNYDFEIQKTIHFVRTHACRKIGLQMPEGLLIYATAIAGLIEAFGSSKLSESSESECEPTQDAAIEIVVLAEVTYGACCIDDFTARALDCDLLVHYGHSCLIPITTTLIRTLYVFVNIDFNLRHLVDTVKLNFPDTTVKLAMIATIQFASSLQRLRHVLVDAGYVNLSIPQARPLSPGEVLGCTSPRLCDDEAAVMYVPDTFLHIAHSQIFGRRKIPLGKHDDYESAFEACILPIRSLHGQIDAGILSASGNAYAASTRDRTDTITECKASWPRHGYVGSSREFGRGQVAGTKGDASGQGTRGCFNERIVAGEMRPIWRLG
jgi:2-(3-amino-3-carboxypropyl)histidine synthase